LSQDGNRAFLLARVDARCCREVTLPYQTCDGRSCAVLVDRRRCVLEACATAVARQAVFRVAHHVHITEGVVEIRRRRKAKSRGRLNRPRPPYGAEWTFQFRTVPFSSLRCCRIRALEKTHQDRRRIGRGAYRVVWQNEFAKLSAEKRRLGPDRRGSKILRWRVGVGIKCRVSPAA
jgi:hypothetical protein